MHQAKFSIQHLVLATKDGGKSWGATRLAGFEIRAVAFASDGKRGWIADSLGKLRQSDDGGQTWRALSVPSLHKGGHGSVLKMLLLPDQRTLLVTFRGGTVMKGRPSSTSWKRMRP